MGKKINSFYNKIIRLEKQKLMQNRQRKSIDSIYSLTKISKQLDILCLGQFNCNYTSFLMQYTGQRRDYNEIENIYVKRMEEKVIFLHEWKDKDDLEFMQQFDGLLFFVDVVHHLNNTTETILKNLETLSQMSGVNVFRIPLTVIALNGSTIKPKEFDNQKRRLQKRLHCILHPQQILYYSSGNKQNFDMISDKLSLFVNNIFENDPQSIKSTWTAYWKLYGCRDLVQPYWIDLQVFWLALMERIPRNKHFEDFKGMAKSQGINQSLFKKLW